MTKFIGKIADVGIAKESVRGTANAAADFYLPKQSISIDDGIDQAIEDSSYGTIEDAVDAKIVAKWSEGEIEGHIFDKSFGLLLLALFGTDTPSGPVQTTVYTHAYTVAQTATHQALTLFVEDANADYKYALGMLKSLSIDVMLGAFAKYTAAFRAKVGATATLTPSYTTENSFLPQHGSIKTATNLAGLAAASVIPIRSVKLNFEKNVEDDRKIGSVDPADILNRKFGVEGTIELVFNDETFKTEMLADTQKAMRIRLTNTDVTIGSSMNPQLTFDLAKVKFSNFKRNYGNEDIVTATVDFKGFYSATDTSMVTGELINTQVSY